MRLLDSRIQRSVDRDIFWRAREFFLEEGALKRSEHGLRVGSRDGYYFDIDYLLNDPIKCQLISDIYIKLIRNLARKKRIDLLAFIEKASGGTIGVLRLAGNISIATKIPNAVIRPKKDIFFERVKIPFFARGEMGIKRGLGGLSAVIVTDHCTTGREALIAQDILCTLGAEVSNVISYTVRSDKFSKDEYNKRGVTLTSAYSLPPSNEMPKSLLEIGSIAVNY